MSLTTLYDEASLWMTPSSASDGKLYSQLPTDGSGDFTFSRGSNLAATRVDVNGLIEKGRENLLLQSNQFDTTWTTFSASVTSGQIGYDGSSDAWLLSKSGASGRLFQNLSASGVLTFSVYMKANASTWGLIQVDGSPNDAYVYVDLQNGTTGSTSSVNIVEGIEDVGNGWYRVSVSVNDVVTRLRIYPAETNSVSATSGSIYIQDAQLEQGLVATDYIETGASTAQAGVLENEPRLDYSGGASCPSLLLEPQRTNLLGQSEYYNVDYVRNNVTLTDNAATSPEGLQNASKLVPNSGTGGNRSIGKDHSGLSGIHTFSTFAKAGEYGYVSLRLRNTPSAFVMFDLNDGTIHNINSNAQYVTNSAKIEDYGDGWYRCSAAFDPSGSGNVGQLYPSLSVGITGDETFNWDGDGTSGIYIYGTQFESGSYPTSYIPTYGTSQTRSDESSTTVFSDLISTQAFTMFFEHKSLGMSGTSWAYALEMADGSDEIEFYVNSGAGMNIYLGGNGGYVFGTSSNDGYRAGLTSKVALSYDGDKLSYFINGSLYDSATGVSFNDVNTYLNLRGSRNIALKQSLVFPTALTDSECIALTIDGLKEDIIASYKTRATTLESGAEDRLDTYLQELEDFIIV